MSRPKIRVAQLYTGGVGSEIVRRCAGHPELELVAVMVHADDKAGRDSGELVGAAANGIVTTQSLDDVLATKPDAAIHSGLLFDLDLITTLLRAGVSVYTGIGGYYLPGSPDFELIDAAAREGNASFSAGGNIPGLISDVWPLFVTGYTGRIRQIRARQWNDVSTYPSGVQIQSLGIGKDVGAEAEYAEMFDAHFTGAIRMSAQMIADGLGVELTDCVLSEKRTVVAEDELTLPASGLVIAQGQVAGIEWTWTATSGDREFLEGHQPADRGARARSGLAPDPRRPAVAGRDRRRAVDRHHVRLARGRASRGVDLVAQRVAGDEHHPAVGGGALRRGVGARLPRAAGGGLGLTRLPRLATRATGPCGATRGSSRARPAGTRGPDDDGARRDRPRAS